jgi:hypothetical protein
MTARRNGRGSTSSHDAGNGHPDALYDRHRGAISMTLFARIFTTKTLLQIVFVLAATVMMKAISLHFDFSWATALAQG